MKILLVTSQITYVPNNCQDFLDELLTKSANDIAGLVILQNFSSMLLPQIVWLKILGCSNFARTMCNNLITLLFQKREKLCYKNNIPILKAKSMNETKIINWVKTNKIDLIINVRTRCIYKKTILRAPRFGCVNVHHGILPTYRGIFCDLYALYQNRPAGISIHQMNEKIDNGEILFTKHISSKNDRNYMNYLSKTGKTEAIVITKLIKYLTKNDKMPKGVKNYSKHAVITRTPNRDTIKAMQKGGIIL